MTYVLQSREDWEPTHRSYKFLARNDSIAVENAIFRLVDYLLFDRHLQDGSKFHYHYDSLKLVNVTKDILVRVPARRIRPWILGDDKVQLYRLNNIEIDWHMFTDTIPYFNYSMTVELNDPYEEKDFKFIAKNDSVAANIAIDTVAYYISQEWYRTNRPIDYINVNNNFTKNSVPTVNYYYALYRIVYSPYCRKLNFKRYHIGLRGLTDW